MMTWGDIIAQLATAFVLMALVFGFALLIAMGSGEMK